MTFAGHACVTTAMFHKNASPKLQERRDESYLTVCNLIKQSRLSNESGIHGVNRQGTINPTSMYVTFMYFIYSYLPNIDKDNQA